MSFWAAAEPGAGRAPGSRRWRVPSFGRAPRHGPWVSLSLREGVCSGEHLLRQPGAPSWGLGRLVDTPGGGPHSPAGRRFGHMPLRASRAERQLRTGRARPRGCLPLLGSLVGPCVTATGRHQALCGVQKEGAEQKYVLGSCPSQRRSSLQVGKPRGQIAAARSLLWEWGKATA